MCKAEFLLFGPKCSVGAVEPRQNTRNPHLALQGPGGGRETMTMTPETSFEVHADPHRAHTACAKPSFYSLAPNARRCGKTETKHTQIRPGSSGPIWHCRGPRNHDDDTGDVARGQRWSTLCMHRVCKAGLSLHGPKCRAGAVWVRPGVRQPSPSGPIEDRLCSRRGCLLPCTNRPGISEMGKFRKVSNTGF